MKLTILTNIYPTSKHPDSGTYVSDQVRSLTPFVETKVINKSQRSAIGFVPFGLKTLWNLLTEKHDIVHAHYGFHSAILAVLLGRKPLVVTFHGSDALIEPKRNRLYRLFQKRVVASASRIIAVSDHIKQELVHNLGADSRKICVLPCGVDTERFRFRSKGEARKRLGLRDDMKLALFIGRLSRAKGVDLIKKASERLPDLNFYFIGTGPIKWHAPNCEFVGTVDHESIPQWINSADVLTLPSRSEGTPVTVLEALASEVPVICSDVGACSEIVLENRTGRLIPPGDAEALSGAIKYVFSWNAFDSKTARQMVVEKYDLNVLSEKLLRLYEEVLETKNGRTLQASVAEMNRKRSF
ncbi:glycosyltransferase family 4 protein [candidate division KSB1 bacterium]|nr:glycosyltransferase family 4 protein [candidate division KSB1 bacterium]NIR68856.1 glycosyltransferase family 4 protein [candidate division KSB1 bacterium]NIS27224.1 glycosyltransferase family 4 protein [candidate division KSB1 bacterium]NIT74109.1 glycosyltransferase family 4 protein [candidate division KSB1 bacterium]NIU27958.1 glycosyltransferase family 4 protein [candidate division KSB1 bacterium]